MTSNKNSINLSLDSILDKYSVVDQRDYQIACITELVEAINNGNDSILHLPTGTGKTITFAPIAIEAAENDYRTCVLCYTKYMQNKVKSDFNRFPGGEISEIVFGVSVYDCPRFNRNADNWTCSENKEGCIDDGYSCDVLFSETNYDKSPLIITNYSKFLTFRGSNWDLIIIDDSHSFETVKEQTYQNTVNYRVIDELYEKYEKNEVIGDFIGIFCDIFLDIFETALPLRQIQGTLGSDYVRRLAEEVFTNDEEDVLKQQIQNLPDKDRQICKEEFQFIKACKNAANFRFFVRKDWFNPEDYQLTELIAREAENTIRYKISDRFRNSRVILATATPGDPNIHASACLHRDFSGDGLRIIPRDLPDPLKSWFNNLDIYLVSNLGDTRVAPNFIRALELASNCIEATQVKTILLFKNYNDQIIAKEFLEGKFDDIYFIEQGDDEDTIHEQANRNRIILASASTRLWEGISINDLQLGIIFTPPFIRVPVHISQRISYQYNERIMLRRLQQGIGRLIRSDTDEGICLLLSSNFSKYIRRSRFSQQLRDRINLINSENLITKLMNKFNEG